MSSMAPLFHDLAFLNHYLKPSLWISSLFLFKIQSNLLTFSQLPFYSRRCVASNLQLVGITWQCSVQTKPLYRWKAMLQLPVTPFYICTGAHIPVINIAHCCRSGKISRLLFLCIHSANCLWMDAQPSQRLCRCLNILAYMLCFTTQTPTPFRAATRFNIQTGGLVVRQDLS